MIATNLEASQTMKGDIKLTLTLQDKTNMHHIQELIDHVNNGKLIDLEVKKHRRKRSLDANSYMWMLLHKMAIKLNSSKEEIYIEIIRRVGRFEMLPLKESVVDEWVKIWKSRGIGWYSEVVSDSKLEGYITTINYYGTSTYKSNEMSIVINEVVEECKNLGIETMTPIELKELLSKVKN